MPLVDEDERRRAERAHQVALFRYQLIREAADPALSGAQRGALVRQIAARTHTDPFGKPVKVTRQTLDRWIRTWRGGGFDALLPPIRQVTPAHPGGGAGPGRGPEAGEPPAHDGPGRPDPAAAPGMGPVLPHRPPAPGPARTADPPGRAGPDGVRPVRGRPAQ
ncbi:helix-turn-helix domain-containing protein [Streptomyces sp. A5-4]|uniref:helix-turn-helix domain-containing protein n=1 Tax=Streptomyces sp. A5-4 TaxID=3384771 RepID=UPI003DA7A88D